MAIGTGNKEKKRHHQSGFLRSNDTRYVYSIAAVAASLLHLSYFYATIVFTCRRDDVAVCSWYQVQVPLAKFRYQEVTTPVLTIPIDPSKMRPLKRMGERMLIEKISFHSGGFWINGVSLCLFLNFIMHILMKMTQPKK